MMITNWNDLSISKLMEINAINELHCGDEEKNCRVAAVLAGITYDELLEMPLSKASELISQIGFLLEEPPVVKVRNTYEIGGIKWRLTKELTTAQYIDFQGLYGAHMERYIREMMAIILVPEGKKYLEGYTSEEAVEILGEMSVPESLGISSFFTRRFGKSIRRTLNLSEVAIRAARMIAPKKDKEQIRAMEIALRTALDELRSLYGSLFSTR